MWPIVWLACQLTGFAAGSAGGSRIPNPPPVLPEAWWPQLVRASAALPLLLGNAGGALPLVVWATVIGLSAVAGGEESAHRLQRTAASAAQPWTPARRQEAQGNAVLRVTGWARTSRPDRWSAPARLLAWSGSQSDGASVLEPARGEGLLVTGSGRPPAPGAVLAGPLRIRVPPAAAVPGGFDVRRFLAGRALRWQASLDTHRTVPPDWVHQAGSQLLAPVHGAIVARLERLLPPTEARLVGAVLLGVRTPESREVSGRFGALGLAHLFAVSGLHVGILLGVVLLPGRLLGWGPRALAVPLLVLMPLYALLTGLPGSVVRAGGMGMLAVWARPCGRRSDPLRLLGLLYWAGAVCDPHRLLDAGQQMSYLAAAGILLVSRATNGFRFSGPGLLRPVLAGLAVSFAAQWFTLPLVAAGFGRFSLLSPLANLLAVPLFGLTLWGVVLALVTSLVGMAPASWLGAWVWLGLRVLEGGATASVGHGGGWNLGLPVPGWHQMLAWGGMTAALFVLLQVRGPGWRARLAAAAAWIGLPCLLLYSFGPAARSVPHPQGIVVWQFDVGQGDCALLAFPDGWLALIDTGGRFNPRSEASDGPLAREVLPFLARQGCRRLDAVLLTHGHLDHTGGVAALAAALPVRTWYVAGHAATALDSLAAARRPVAGEVLHTWRDWALTVKYPLPGQERAASENNWSLVVVLSRLGQGQMVWSGDLELAGEAHLLAEGAGLGRTRILKAGHHGSNTSGSPELLAELGPELVLISCGAGNSYGHPSHGPFVRPGTAGPDTIASLRTDLDGSIQLRWSPEGRLQWHTAAQAGQLAPMP